jgi:hypothetical protein
MASKEQKKLQKRKERDKKNRDKLLYRRAVKTKKQQEENAEYHKSKRIEKLQRELGELNQWSDEVLKKVPNDTLTQLEKNAKILKSLEDEYEQERAKKRQLNESLESEGSLTLEQKMAKLHAGLSQTQIDGISCLDESKLVVEGSTSGRIGMPRKEISEVQVIKAPVTNSEENSSEA